MHPVNPAYYPPVYDLEMVAGHVVWGSGLVFWAMNQDNNSIEAL